jgi:hypothetical protein
MMARFFLWLGWSRFHRVPPPAKRACRVYNVVWLDPFSQAEWPISVTVAFYPNGRPCEVFAQLEKSSSTLDAALIASARMMSHLLQRGVKVRDLAHIVGEYGSPVDVLPKALLFAEGRL